MIAYITAQLLKDVAPTAKPYDIRDKTVKGFLLRVNPSGKLVYMCEYGRAKRMMIGKAGVISLAKAREEAKKILADATLGVDPKNKRQLETCTNQTLTLKKFIDEKYAPWIESRGVSGSETVKRIKGRFFNELGNKQLSEITVLMMETWCTKRLKSVSGKTIERDVAALRAALNRAVRWKLINANPLTELELIKTKREP